MSTNGSGQRLVIVESPTKVKTIAGFLGDGYIVESSRGHVRDLPGSAAEVPAKYKGEKWARDGVNVNDEFKPIYVVHPDKKPTIKALKSALADADELLLATDGDREGEAIAWHLLEELKPKVPVKRMVFHEITPRAIEDALQNTRDLDLDLVDAQETRRILDRLYGYGLSPVLWKKVKPRLSAGRVQSVATRLVVDRERERIAFRAASYWDLDATLNAGSDAEPPQFPARLTQVDGRKIAQGRDFDDRGGLSGKGADNLVHLDQAAAEQLAGQLGRAQWQVASVDAKPYRRSPYAPFRTTTLQQEAGRKLGFSAQRTMSVAQDLYEAGHITYMRTDSVTLSGTAIGAARNQVRQLFGPDFLPEKPRVYASKVKNAQEAHEAIRPAGEVFRTPAQTGLKGDQFRLYELIWKRTVASQMKDAEGQSISVQIDATPTEGPACTFVASGRTITFHGFLKAYVESVEESGGKRADDAQTRLPRLAEGQQLTADEVTASGHETKPPARYTEPSLVAKLEELNIGRPSTYASIIRTITARDYVYKKGSALVPTWLAFAVTRLLEEHFPNLVDYAFTAGMEELLDQIAGGRSDRVKVLSEFYFGDDDTTGLHELITELGDLDARKLNTFPLGDLDSGVVLRVGQYGPYVQDEEGNRGNVPDDLPPDELTVDLARELLAKPAGEARELGTHPETGNPVVAKDGRFGPYVSEKLPEDAPKGTKPRTASLFKTMDPETVTLETALKLMSLPRVVGTDAEGEEIKTQNGRYGPYLSKGKETRSLQSEEQIFEITLSEAEALLAQPKQRGRAAAKPPLKELGTDPSSEKPIVVKDGRFGPYITDGVTNVTVRRGQDIESLTNEIAVDLLAEKRAKGPAPKKRAAKKTTKKTAAKKTAAKKTTAKKAPAKKTTAKKAPAKKTAAKKTSAAPSGDEG